MKAITLTQPWATLIAIGAKKTETRSWSTTYRGSLAIHAAKGWTADVIRISRNEPYKTILAEAGYSLFSQLPRGSIVATCILRDCISTRRFQGEDFLDSALGDFTIGRFAWILSDVKTLAELIAARGALGIWEWEG